MSRYQTSLGALLQGLLPECQLPPGVAELQITGIENDSRRIQGGDLFLACKGLSVDGNRFAAAAVTAGAAAVVTEQAAELSNLDVPVIELSQLSERQGELAARFYQHPSRALRAIGITGTNGKTSISHFVARALSQLGSKTAVIGTTGNGFVGALESASHTTPDAVSLQRLLAQLQQQGAEAVAMEVSSHALEQGRVAGVAFDQAVFTNLSRDHLDYHGTMEAYGAAKAKLFEQYGISQAVINTDDPFGRQLWQRLGAEYPDVQRLAIGEQPIDPTEGGQLRILTHRLTGQGIQADIASPWGELRVDSPLLGRFNLYNLLGALGALIGAGIEPQAALAALNQLDGVDGRMQAFKISGQPLVVVDYAHTPDALDKALASLRNHCSGRLWCLFGCGGDRDRGKRASMAQAAEQWADRLVVTSDNPRSEDPQQIIDDVLAGIDDKAAAVVEPDRRVAIERAVAEAAPGDVVLVAGKGHEDYQEINGVREPFSDIDWVKKTLGINDAV